MNKLISYLVSAVLAALFLYFIGFIIAGIIAVISIVVNRVIVYKKKHRRFTDWEFKYSRVNKTWDINGNKYERIEVYERFDRALNITEERKESKPIAIRDELGETYSLNLESVLYETNVASKRKRKKVEAEHRSQGLPVYR